MQNLLKDLITKIKTNASITFIGTSVYILGIILALIFSAESLTEFYKEYALNFYVTALNPSSSSFSFLFKRILNVFLLYIPVVLLSFNQISVYFNFVIVFYSGFTLSLSLKGLFILFKFNGIFVFLFLSLIQSVLTAISIIIFILLIKANPCDNRNFLKYVIKVTVISLIIALIGVFVEFLFLVTIIRPFNFFF